MTYAVWAFPKKLVIERSHEVAEVYNLLLEAKAKALNNIEEIVNVSMGMLGGSKAFWQAYFEHIYYGLNQEYLLGLKTYFDFCYELGNLTSNPVSVLAIGVILWDIGFILHAVEIPLFTRVQLPT